VEAGSQDDVDRDEEVDAESLLQDDSRLDSVSVEPVLPIDMVLPICMPMAFIGLASVTVHTMHVVLFIYATTSHERTENTLGS